MTVDLSRRGALGGAALAMLAACAEVMVAPAPVATATPVPATPATPAAPAAPTLADQAPPAPREFRGAWIASVNNIDWPSKTGLSADAQRAEAIAMLERARTLGLNAVILQVRPAGDALYRSTLEPWSEALSGEQGKAPGYDPLAFWVEQAHKRGLELHAWFNPYRARPSTAKSALVAPHIAVRQPALVKRYGDMLWMDPGEPAAAQHTLAVVADVVRRYDIDGVHIDDYFYPYPVQARDGSDQPFPDDEAWARYQLGGGTLARDDWRRNNVDALVQEMHRTVHQIKPWVRFGVSPFGIGRPERRPAGITGFSQYDKLYADVERWLAAGWLDYFVPQLYWPIDREGQQFGPLLDGWIAENTQQRHLWPGLFTSQVTRGEALGPRSWAAREIVDQVALQRTRGARAGGHVHFSMAALMQDRDGVATLLQTGPYAQPALVPATPWLGNPQVPAPRLRLSGTRVAIEPAPVWLWAVWRRVGGPAGTWRFSWQPAAERIIEAQGADAVVVAAVDRLSQLSARVAIPLP